MKPSRIVLLVLGSLVALLGFGLLGAGGALGWATATQRDDGGFFTTSEERFATDSFALRSDKIDLGEPGPGEWWADRDLATVKVSADGAGTEDLFVGVGAEQDVEAFLSGVPHDVITDVDFGPFSADYRLENAGGTATPSAPAEQAFWAAQASGPATQTLTWDLEPGRWTIVVMHADGTPGVTADLQLGGKIDYLAQIIIGLVAGGVALLAVGAAMIIGGVAGHPQGAAAADAGVAPATGYPVRVEGRLDPALSRWQWLVKWFLAIPHFVILVFLWIAFAVLTMVAFFAILFTGKYPRRIFEFNTGVLRWSWRVGYYAVSALGTDRYPPFTLAPADYPATLEIAYPEQLSRGLVLVKSWLLAIPHLLIVAVFTATWTFGDGDGAGFVLGGGLLGLLVAIAAISLLFTRRYPAGLHDLVVGVNRWTYRVVAYVALMTDVYPPFRLDQGGTEPVTGATEPAAVGQPVSADVPATGTTSEQ